MTDETPTIEQPDGNDKGNDGPGGAPPEPETKPKAEQPKRLRRSSDDRVLVGVAGGLGRYFGVDPVIFRIGFVISLFFGGLGALAYLLLAVFVPTDGDPDRAQRVGGRLQRTGFWRGLALVAIALVAISGLFALAGGAAFAVAIGWGVPVAIGIIVIGALICLAAFRGGARWAIPPVLALVIGAGVASAADLDFKGGIGEREHHPISAESIPADGYKLGIGHLVVDLRDLDWSKRSVLRLNVELGAGQADVFVPEQVCIVGSAHTGAGEIEVVGERNDGVDVDHSIGTGSTAKPRLEIDANVDVGQLRIINSNTAGVDNFGYGPGPFHEDTAPQRAAEARACGTR